MKIHKEGYGIITRSFFIIAIFTLLTLYFSKNNLLDYGVVAAAVILFFFICRFFRVPKREAVKDDNAIIAPADGKVVIIKEVYEPEFLKEKCIQVSIFMNVFNVHINWFPVKGLVEYYKYHPGRYLVAFHPKSSEKNERTSIAVNTGNKRVLFRQIAGLLARRIVCYAIEGSEIQQCQQAGFIKFGSRIDLFLPLDSRIQATRGQKVTGSRTVIARLSDNTSATE